MSKRAVLDPAWELRAVKKRQERYLATQGIRGTVLPAGWAAAWHTWPDAADALRAMAKRGDCDHDCNSIFTSVHCSEEMKVWD